MHGSLGRASSLMTYCAAAREASQKVEVTAALGETASQKPLTNRGKGFFFFFGLPLATDERGVDYNEGEGSLPSEGSLVVRF